MTLLVTVMAAAAVTVIWYVSKKARALKISTLCYMYWGAALMWLVDSTYDYYENGADYFTPAIPDMINDLFLGLSAVVFGLIIWTVYLLVKDPEGTVRSLLVKKS